MPNPSPTPRQHFNSRPSARGDNMDSGWDFTALISIHAPPRGATNGTYLDTRDIRISIHAPPRGATLPSNIHKQLLIYFNSRPSARGDIGVDYRLQKIRLFQFTPLREGRLSAAAFSDSRKQISIHAPPRGATPILPALFIPEVISIHAPPRGATDKTSSAVNVLLLFQFTPLREGRLEKGGLTVTSVYFNSRPSARGDCAGAWRLLGLLDFNSRPSARGDLPSNIHKQLLIYFNSRPSARGDGCMGG